MKSAAILASLILLACIGCLAVSIIGDAIVIWRDRRRALAELERFRNIRPDRPEWMIDQGTGHNARRGR